MATKAGKDLKEAKRGAVVARLRRAMESIDILSGMWDERTLDILILALGIGHVEVDAEE